MGDKIQREGGERGHKKSNAPLKKYKVGLGVLKFAEGNLEGSKGCGGGEGEGGGWIIGRVGEGRIIE